MTGKEVILEWGEGLTGGLGQDVGEASKAAIEQGSWNPFKELFAGRVEQGKGFAENKVDEYLKPPTPPKEEKFYGDYVLAGVIVVSALAIVLVTIK